MIVNKAYAGVAPLRPPERRGRRKALRTPTSEAILHAPPGKKSNDFCVEIGHPTCNNEQMFTFRFFSQPTPQGAEAFMLRSQEIARVNNGNRNSNRGRTSRCALNKSFGSPSCRSPSNLVATQNTSKRLPANDLGLMSPKTRLATEGPSRHNVPRRVDWRDADDGIRHHTAALWQGMLLEQRRRFLPRLRPFWEVGLHWLERLDAPQQNAADHARQRAEVGVMDNR